jgi:hypothetical protein
MPSGIALRGVPIESLSALEEGETLRPEFAAAQGRFLAARGDGTALLPVGSQISTVTPALYLRRGLMAALAATSAGEELEELDEDGRRVQLELRLALAETLALRSESPPSESPPPEPSPADPGIPWAIAVADPEPPWLADVRARSALRLLQAGQTAAVPELPEGRGTGDMHVRAKLEGAYWRATPPHGGETAREGAARSELLESAAAAPVLDVEMYELPLGPRAAAPAPDWLGSAISLIGSRASAATGPAPATDPEGDGLRAAVLRRFTEGATATTVLPGPPPIVIRYGVEAVLGQIDIMRNYGLQTM